MAASRAWSAGAPSAHRFLHERADPCLVGGGQLFQREGDRPQGAFVEVRAVVEAERRVPRLELVRGLEEADDLAVLGICGHPVPELRREGWRAGFDDRMEPLGRGRDPAPSSRRSSRARRFPRPPCLAFTSLARSRTAARSSSVNPLDALSVAVVLLADFSVAFLSSAGMWGFSFVVFGV